VQAFGFLTAALVVGQVGAPWLSRAFAAISRGAGMKLTLALAICRDGEGVTKVVKIVVDGATTAAAAKCVASTIATSNLVKTALFGEDANWGRIMGAIGRSGVAIDPDKLTVRFDDVVMVKRGMGVGLAAERKIARVFKRNEFTISVNLGQGQAQAHMWTTDLSYDYVRINASYRS